MHTVVSTAELALCEAACSSALLFRVRSLLPLCYGAQYFLETFVHLEIDPFHQHCNQIQFFNSFSITDVT